jgi:hypothetical protein
MSLIGSIMYLIVFNRNDGWYARDHFYMSIRCMSRMLFGLLMCLQVINKGKFFR